MFFQKYVKVEGQGHGIKSFGMDRNVLPQGIFMCDMKAFYISVQKLLQRLSFWSRSNLNVKVIGPNILVQTERSFHKE